MSTQKQRPVFYDGEPAVVAAVEMAAGTDIQRLGARLERRLARFENAQPIGIALNVSTYQARNVTASVNGAVSNVGQTFIVVFLTMLLFLGLRAATVIAMIVPFTIGVALAVMTATGVDVEKVSIAAVIISLGLLVDNGLVVVEDIQGRIDAGVEPRAAALEAGGQYLVPLAVASIPTVSAFVPMLLMEGTEGEFAFSLGAVVAAMLAGSWLTALYILPYLCTRLLKARGNPKAERGRLSKWYGRGCATTAAVRCAGGRCRLCCGGVERFAVWCAVGRRCSRSANGPSFSSTWTCRRTQRSRTPSASRCVCSAGCRTRARTRAYATAPST